MRLRTLLAALTVALVALPAAAADGPAAVLQTAPYGRILTDVRAAAVLVAGDTGSMAIDNGLKEWLGEKGFSGLDLTKPLLGYVVYDEKDATQTSFVLLAGITKEEDFLDLLERGGAKPIADKDQKGLYKLGSFEMPQGAGAGLENKPFDVIMRISGNTAYVGFNVKAALLDPSKVYKPEQLIDAKETALVTFRQFNDRMPAEVGKNAMKAYEEMIKGLKESIPPGNGLLEAQVMKSVEKLMQYAMKMGTEAKESGSRLTIDTTSGELSIDSYYVPKAGTDFAKAILERKPTVNQFGALVGSTTAAGVMMQLPVGLKEVQDLMVLGMEKGQEEIKKNPPPPFLKDIVEESITGMIRTVKSGTLDIGVTINGPDKDGHFVAAAAFSFDNAIPLEKAIKANFKDLPPPVSTYLKLDVDKIGEVNVHAIELPDEATQTTQQFFGDSKIYFAFGPKQIVVAVGNGSKDALKTALTAKPAPANAFDVLVNPKRLTQAVTAVNPQLGGQAEGIMGNEDKTYSAYSFSISGGDALRMKFGVNLKILPKWAAAASLR